MTMPLRRLCLCACALVPALAQSDPSSQWGLDGQLNLPTGNLKDYLFQAKGFGIGFHETLDFHDGTRLRGRVEWNKYNAGESTGTFTGPGGALYGPGLLHDEAQNLTFAMDYLRTFNGTDRGLYGVLGLAAVRWRLQTGTPFANDTLSTTKLGWSAGLGWQWNHHFGTEVRFNGSSITPDLSGNSCSVGFNWSF